MSEQKRVNSFVRDFILYGIITFVLMIIGLIYWSVSGKEQWGVNVYFFYAICGTVLGALGGAIGNLVRKILKPSSIEAENFIGYFNKHVFWVIGPQLIGWAIGFAITIHLIETFFGVKLK